MSVLQCVIIGSGPAGYTAAVYAARANMKPVIYQGIQPGGQLTITTDVENYPGFRDAITGPALMEEFEAQARRVGAEIIFDTVTRVDISDSPFSFWDGEGQEHKTKTIIIATGASAKWLGLESEQRFNGSGVSACAVCDGFFFKDKEVSIVGAGDTACEEALYLSKICTKVHMIVRRDEMRASQIMQKRVLSKENIQVYFNTETVEVLGTNKVEGVRVSNNKTNVESRIDVNAFFVAIGHTPNSELFKEQLNMDAQGYIFTNPDSSETNVPGVFACGDVQDKKYRQAVTAAGSGCMAALDAERYLGSLE